MPRKKKDKTPLLPSEERASVGPGLETQNLLKVILADMQLRVTHPIVANQVKVGVSRILKHLGHKGVADYWDALPL